MEYLTWAIGLAWAAWFIWTVYKMLWPKAIEFEITEEELFWVLPHPKVQCLRMNYNTRTDQYWLYWFPSERKPVAVDLILERRKAAKAAINN